MPHTWSKTYLWVRESRPAACKTIVKQRLCCSGMKWNEVGAAVVLSLRTLSHSRGRWEQFWNKIDQYGFPVIA